jgi:hypothetical protein
MHLDRIAAAYQPYLLSLFRFVTGLTLFQFGLAKLFKLPAVPMFDHVTPFSQIGAAGMLELVLGGMLMLGLLTGPSPSCCRARWRSPTSSDTFRRIFSRCSMVERSPSCSASPASIWRRRARDR